MPEGEFDFLGYTFGRVLGETGKPAGPTAIEEEHRHMVEKIHALTDRGNLARGPELVDRLNRALRGWANYFSVGSVYLRIGPSTLHRGAAAPVVALQAQGQATKGGSYPLSHLYGHLGWYA